jgi:hypothetical protein
MEVDFMESAERLIVSRIPASNEISQSGIAARRNYFALTEKKHARPT